MNKNKEDIKLRTHTHNWKSHGRQGRKPTTQERAAKKLKLDPGVVFEAVNGTGDMARVTFNGTGVPRGLIGAYLTEGRGMKTRRIDMTSLPKMAALYGNVLTFPAALLV